MLAQALILAHIRQNVLAHVQMRKYTHTHLTHVDLDAMNVLYWTVPAQLFVSLLYIYCWFMVQKNDKNLILDNRS